MVIRWLLNKDDNDEFKISFFFLSDKSKFYPVDYCQMNLHKISQPRIMVKSIGLHSDCLAANLPPLQEHLSKCITM